MLLSPALTAEMRRILALAWPVVLTSLNWTILHVTDVAVVGLVSTSEVGGVGREPIAHLSRYRRGARLADRHSRLCLARRRRRRFARDRARIPSGHAARADAGAGQRSDAVPVARTDAARPRRCARHRARGGGRGAGDGARLSVSAGHRRRELLSRRREPAAARDRGQFVDPAAQCRAGLGARHGPAGTACHGRGRRGAGDCDRIRPRRSGDGRRRLDAAARRPARRARSERAGKPRIAGQARCASRISGWCRRSPPGSS